MELLSGMNVLYHFYEKKLNEGNNLLAANSVFTFLPLLSVVFFSSLISFLSRPDLWIKNTLVFLCSYEKNQKRSKITVAA